MLPPRPAPASAPSALPSPGREVTAAGDPPAGATIGCAGPDSGTTRVATGPAPVTPGSAGATLTWGAGLLFALEMVAAGTVTSKRVFGGEPSRLRYRPNQSRTSERSRSASSRPPSWPPPYQTTLTGVPCAAIPRALASASDSGNSESASPWTSRVGAVIRSSTVAGLDSCSRASALGVASPVVATCS